MARFLYQVAYTPGAWDAMTKNPQDRLKAVTPAIEAHGGKLIDGYYAFGKYDLIAIVEMPSNVNAAAFAVAAAAGGAVSAIRTTVLLTSREGVAAMTQAGKSKYSPPAAKKAAAKKKR